MKPHPARFVHPRSYNVLRTVHENGSIGWVDLVNMTVPHLSPNPNALSQFILRMERSGDVVVHGKRQNNRRDILSVSMTLQGVMTFFPNSKPAPPLAPPAPPEPPKELMPCNQPFTKCYHNGCYLRFDCKAHPDYVFAGEQTEQ